MGIFKGPVPFPITECSEHLALNALSLSEMGDIAHVLTLDRKGQWGFLSPQQYVNQKQKP